MKNKGHGQARVLTPEELKQLFEDGFITERDRTIFAICLFSGCRISEALALKRSDIKCQTITFRKSTTKGKLSTRTIDISSKLAAIMQRYVPPIMLNNPFLFPSRCGKPLSRSQAHRILEKAYKRIGLEGISTHSFRRTALTMMSDANKPLRHIQGISGHKDLGTLQRYLEVSQKHLKEAVSVIGW